MIGATAIAIFIDLSKSVIDKVRKLIILRRLERVKKGGIRMRGSEENLGRTDWKEDRSIKIEERAEVDVGKAN